MTLLSVSVLLCSFLQQVPVSHIAWIPQRIEDLKYPALPKQARLEGVVKLQVVLSEKGTIEDLKAVEGHPLLAAAAKDNVKKWTFRRIESAFTPSISESVILTYIFKIEGLSENPKQTFTFEYPGLVTVTSEAPCVSHVICREDPSYRPTPMRK